MNIHDLPAVNATLNGTAAVLLITAYIFILQRKVTAHKRTMIAALCVSSAFLVCYLVYHWNVGSVRFKGTGLLRNVYLTILATHTVLAVSVPFLAIITLRRGLAMRIERHRAIARWTLPIWLYVSVTGVVVYWMLYRL